MAVDPGSAASVASTVDVWGPTVLGVYLTVLLGVIVKLFIGKLDDMNKRVDTTNERINVTNERIDATNERLTAYERAQHACQLDNASHFVTKDEFKADADRQWGKIDDHATRLARLESRGGLNQ